MNNRNVTMTYWAIIAIALALFLPDWNHQLRAQTLSGPNVSNGALDFGQVTVGTSVQEILTFSTPTAVDIVTPAMTDDPAFVITNDNCPATLGNANGPIETCSIALEFTPIAATSSSGTLSLEYCDSSSFMPRNAKGFVIQCNIITISLRGQGIQPPTATITTVDASADEESGDSASFRVSIDQLSPGLTIDYSISGSASNGVDYVNLPGSVAIPMGSTFALITVTPLDDLLDEALEDVTLTLQPGSGYVVGSPDNATVTITDNELSASITATDNNANENGDPGNFSIALNRAETVDVTVNYSVAGTATAGSDYQALPASVTIPAGQQQIDLPVIPLSDNEMELDETVIVSLQAGANYLLGSPDTATVTIVNDELIASITATDATADEAGDPGNFSINLNRPAASAVTINYTIAGTATAGSDYQTLPTSVTIAAGQQQVDLPVIAFSDNELEPAETIIIVLQAGVDYQVGSPANATVTIVPPGLAVASVIASDPDASEQSLDPGEFTISLEQPAAADLTINYTLAGSADNGADYQMLTGSVDIAFGQSSAQIPVLPLADNDQESLETIELTLAAGLGYAVGSPASATVNLADENRTVMVEAIQNADEQGPVSGLFRISLSAPSEQTLQIIYALSGTASEGDDYTALGNQVQIPAGQLSVDIVIAPVVDDLSEGDETVMINLLSIFPPNVGFQLGAQRRAQLLILDFVDDTPTPPQPPPEQLPQVSINAVADAAEEGPVNGAFSITLDIPAPDIGLVVSYDIAGSATAAVDYQALSGTVNIAAGQTTATITVVPISDSEVEDSETVELSLRAAADYLLDPNANQASISIIDPIITDTPLSEIPNLTSPQRQIARTVENLCRNRTATDNFLRDCDPLIEAAISNDPNAASAISEITPNDVSTAVDAAESSVQAQLQNVRTRLFSIRRGRTGIDVDGLNIDYDAWAVSGQHLRLLMEQNGGAAGDDNAAQRQPGRLGGFISGNINLGERDGSENQDGFDFSSYGLTAGLDYRFSDRLVAGAALTYSTGETEIDGDGGVLDNDGYGLTLYGTYYFSDRLYVDSSLSYSQYRYEQERRLRYQLEGSVVDQTFDADYDGTQYALDISGGYEFVVDRWLITPTVRLSYVEANVDGFSERARDNNAGSAWAVSVNDQKQRSLTASVGGQVSYVIEQSWGSLTPQLDIEWVHEFSNDDLVVNGRFVEGNDVPENSFELTTDELDSSYFSLGARLSTQWNNGATAYIEYRTVLGYENLTDHAINASFRWRF